MNISALVNLSKQMSTRNPVQALKFVIRALRIDPHHETASNGIRSKLKGKRERTRRKIVPR
jgi:hypothetical protein